MHKLGERLRDLRIEKGLSIKALSKEINVSSSSICRWENGQADVPGMALITICKYFGVSSDYLLGLED